MAKLALIATVEVAPGKEASKHADDCYGYGGSREGALEPQKAGDLSLGDGARHVA